jgi:hypothetical protein
MCERAAMGTRAAMLEAPHDLHVDLVGYDTADDVAQYPWHLHQEDPGVPQGVASLLRFVE